LIPLHFNSPRINTYKKPGRGSLLPAPKVCNSSLPAPRRRSERSEESLCLLCLLCLLCSPRSLQECTSISFHGAYASFVFILLRALLHSAIRQLFSPQSLSHSFHKTPGVGMLHSFKPRCLKMIGCLRAS
jgi:hypothetical protein